MVGLGIGEIVGALVLGYIQDNFSRKVTFIANLFVTVIGFGIAIAYTINYEFTLVFGFIMTFFWAIQDAGINTLI